MTVIEAAPLQVHQLILQVQFKLCLNECILALSLMTGWRSPKLYL